jgi:3-deoxy-D-manno-octulosonic-acid transferase
MVYLCWRGFKQPEYWRRWAQRWGFYATKSPFISAAGPRLWVHAVSVGETQAAAGVVAELLERHASLQVLLTHATPTGRATGQALFKLYADRVQSAYLPYDYPGAVRRFLRYWTPDLGLILETEVWPNLLRACRAEQLSVSLINARLSEKSLKLALKRRALIQPALGHFSSILAQSSEDAERINSLLEPSKPRALVCGNLKFDVAVNPELNRRGQQWSQSLKAVKAPCQVVLLASSREGEELDFLRALKQKNSVSPKAHLNVIYMVVPRHPQRFNEVAELIAREGFLVLKRSDSETWPLDLSRELKASSTILLGDSLGEMAAYYALADLVLMGGSFGHTGSQNLIEPCAQGKPVILGPSIFNFKEAAEQALKLGAAKQVTSMTEGLQLTQDWLTNSDDLRRAGAAAEYFVTQHEGSLKKHLKALEPQLNSLLTVTGH